MQSLNQTAYFSVRYFASAAHDRDSDAIVCGIFAITGLLLTGLAIYFGAIPGTD
jgi:hypothetical protein